MEREKMRNELDELVRKVKEAHSDVDIDRILSLKGQLDVEPMHFYEYEKDVVDKYEDDAFCIYKTERHIHYMTRGGYHIFVQPNYESLYKTLEGVMYTLKRISELTDEERDIFIDNVEAIKYILLCPLFVTGNYGAMLEVATQIVKSLSKILENAEPENEEHRLNEDFKQAEIGLDNLQKHAGELEKLAQ